MWISNGTTASGKEVSYKIPASKDTDKGHVIGLTYAEHAKGHPTDPLEFSTIKLNWSSDNVHTPANAHKLKVHSNYIVERRIGIGEWERVSPRAHRNAGNAEEVLEGFASANPEEKYRVKETFTAEYVTAVSKNAKDVIDEKPVEPVQEKIEVQDDKVKEETPAKTPAKTGKTA